ncbi:MAG: bi-domain-containing oxidoreductase [Actinomycetota bacterium]|nr:bi-domain-containing oxidoreductase [Actinomycetota bacterium]
MKQLVQNYKTGELFLADIPVPILAGSGAIVRNHYSLISAGTERTKIETGQKSLLAKAKSRPDLVKKVLDNIKTEGLVTTAKNVFKKLEEFSPLGYSSCGEVTELTDDIRNIKIGDLVACGGAGFANHAEYVFIPKNLLVKIPENVDAKYGAFTTVGAIAMQGVRLANCQFGSKVMIIGLGLIGQLTAQLFNSSGIDVFGADIEDKKVSKGFENGLEFGCNINSPDLEEKALSFTEGNLFDAVIITASTSSNKPVEIAGRLCREKGKVVVVGAVRMDIPREDYYKKEIDLVISRSYGPGRYDRTYEETGIDYPMSYVRWTENRNMQSFLSLIARGKIDLKNLVSKVYDFYKEYEAAYKDILGEASVNNYGLVFKYDIEKSLENRKEDIKLIEKKIDGSKKIFASFIGSGNYAQKFLLPLFAKNSEVSLKSVSSATGLTAANVAKSYKFETMLSDPLNAFEDKESNLIIIATRHDTHADYVSKAIKSGKNVFVEKPLCISKKELKEIDEQYRKGNSILMVGFNRRFSKITGEIKKYFQSRNYPLVVNYRINAGRIDKSSWIQDIDVGGGRIAGELCHFIDFAACLIGKNPVSVYAAGFADDKEIILTDTLMVSITYEDGSIANISYLANGGKKLAKEYIEIFGGGISAIIDDFKSGCIYTDKEVKNFKARGQDKGQDQMVPMFIDKILKEGKSLISYEDIYNTTLLSFLVTDSLKTGNKVKVENQVS